MGDVRLSCTDLVVGYNEVAVLPALSVKLGAGEFWAVVGRNGSGKTTWFRTMLGLLPPVSGTVHNPGIRLSYVQQRMSFDDLGPVSVHEVVAMGLERGWSFAGFGARLGVSDALREVGAADLEHRPFRSLSEGQKQRVLLARVVASRADVVFLDEPTAAMDPVAEQEALGLLDQVRKSHGTTVVVVSHYLGVAREWADRVVFVDRAAQVALEGLPDEVFAHEAFRKRYGLVAGRQDA